MDEASVRSQVFSDLDKSIEQQLSELADCAIAAYHGLSYLQLKHPQLPLRIYVDQLELMKDWLSELSMFLADQDLLSAPGKSNLIDADD